MDIEKLAKEIFAECEKAGEPVTIEEAMEMAKMEAGARSQNHVERSANPKPATAKKTKETKVSPEKTELFNLLWEGLYNFYGENAKIITNNKIIEVKIGEKTLKIDLIEHRIAKNK